MVNDLHEVSLIVRGVMADYPEVSAVGVFGSFSRGQQTDESDVDLLVSFDESPTYSRFFDFRQDLERAFGRSVDIVTTLQNAMPFFIDELKRDTVCVYER